MAQFLVLHTVDPKMFTSDAQMTVMKAVVDVFTADTYCITSWGSPAAAKIACLWEAPSEQAIIDAIAKGTIDLPVDGIYPTMVIDWAEVKKMLAGG